MALHPIPSPHEGKIFPTLKKRKKKEKKKILNAESLNRRDYISTIKV